MKATQIVEAILQKLSVPSGRHLYGVLGTYSLLDHFAKQLHQAKSTDGFPFSKPVNVNRGILDEIPDDEFKHLAENEAKRPEPTRAHVAEAFNRFLRKHLTGKRILVLSKIEMLFAYQIELSLLRTIAADSNRVLLLLPGHRYQGRIIMFNEMVEGNFILPVNLIAENHLWEVSE